MKTRMHELFNKKATPQTNNINLLIIVVGRKFCIKVMEMCIYALGIIKLLPVCC